MADPQIKIEVTGKDVEALAATLVALAAKVAPQMPTAPVSADMPLDELLAIVRAKATAEGFKLIVVKADGGETQEPPQAAHAPDASEPMVYEPKAVKRRGRRTKAEMEAARAAETAASEAFGEEVVEAVEPAEADEPSVEETVVWEDPKAIEAEAVEDPKETPAAMSDAELETLKRATMKKLLDIHKSAGGPEKVEDVLVPYKKMGFAAAATIPPRYYIDIAKRLEAI